MNRRRGHLPRKLRIPKRISGLVGWYDGSAEVLTIKDGSNLITTWIDRSGNGNHLVAAAGDRPTWVANQQNGRGVVNFNGTDEMDMPSGLFTLPSAANTIFVVSRRTSESGATETIYNLSDGVTAEAFGIYPAAASQFSFRNREGAGTNITLTGVTTTNFNIFESYFNGSTSHSGTVNNGTPVTQAATTATGINSGDVGANNAANLLLTGDVAELIFYNRELTATERSTIKTYLSVKWGITIS